MTYCFRCGLQGRPISALGVDEDGEPACGGHATGMTPLSVQNSQPLKKEAPAMAKRICKCGCGQEIPVHYSSGKQYIRGHKTAKAVCGPAKHILREDVVEETDQSGLLSEIDDKLNDFLIALPISAKVQMVESYLKAS